ncbi:hypothetical protein BDV96DRAFT_54241 [Lophiotrema nucula]|uniref:Uncharacterized protein n=1 Tax=Lophiotrema nucula TaxID=690887 RepID=A0A6A5Z8B5_9PLEO|nr:hypothetical protein BDV96DRAFT_54241 [Lophiotrema nucula]
MSGLEPLAVVGAVAAVVSAFHGGAELVAHLKKKHRRRKSQQQFEEQQLQDSLETGENTVGQRYSTDMKELGEIVRVGDAIARDRLLHVAVVMQAEIIKSLKLAITHESAVLNLKILHEASILNRTESITTLDEMKQRILISRPLPRTLPPAGPPDDMRGPRASIGSMQTLLPSVPDEYVPQAVTLPAAGDTKDTKTGLARYFSMKRNNSQSSSSSSVHHSSSSAENPTFSPALNYLLQQGNDRGSIMKDIDEIIASYQGLHTDDDPWSSHGGYGAGAASKRDTLDVLNSGGGYKRDTVGLNREAMHRLMSLPPTPEGHENTEYPAFNNNAMDPSAHYFAAPNPLPQRQMQLGSRWSGSSSVYSDSIPPSLYSNDSRGSAQSPTPPLVPDGSPLSPSASPIFPVSGPHHSRSVSLPPLMTQQSQPSRSQAGFMTPQEPRSPITEEQGQLKVNRTRVHLVPNQGSPVTNKPLPTPLPSLSTTTTPSRAQPPPPPFLAKTHSTASSTSTPSLSTATIAGPPTSSEKMMDGRPCKDNNYWGFCKGAWAVREELKKGLSVQTRPDGMYNSHQIWGCRHCHFTGETFSASVPGKKKKAVIVDPGVYSSAVGVRYRWIFLAKSHVKQKSFGPTPASYTHTTSPSSTTHTSHTSSPTCNFGCLICSTLGNVTGIYGNVETLMNHIFLEHARELVQDEKVRWKGKVVMGRVAAAEEEWDLNIPDVEAVVG